ncbi:geranylgeranylglyceryl/heptaprenylglyceryl phosphate synthase [Flavobacteriaceae bacterium M23B6Z8]
MSILKNSMHPIYAQLLNAKERKEPLMAVLIDPEDFPAHDTEKIINLINQSPATHIFVGGSEVREGATHSLVKLIRPFTSLPILIFPGDEQQITPEADALLFLILLSGRNPEYLIEKQVRSAAILRKNPMETVSTGYILVDGGNETAVQRKSRTQPISMQHHSLIADTALAGELLGNKLMYLEAGSGASYPVSKEVIKSVRDSISIPLIVGGGIKTVQQMHDAYTSGADMLVIGTAFEKDPTFFKALNHLITS